MNKTTVRELIDSGKYGIFADYFWTYITEDHLERALDSYGYEATGMKLGLDRCSELADSDGRNGASYMQYIYSRQEIYMSHELSETKLFFFPRKKETELSKESEKAFALVIPGGGFARQWTLIEGFSVAAKLNEIGISAFVLLYRTAQKGVFQKALKDMYRAISFIQENAVKFDVNKERYIMGGFSAGATLAGEMASDNLGWKAGNLPKPELIFLGYPAQRMDFFYQIWEKAPEGSPAKLSMSDFLELLIPGEITKEALAPLSLEDHLSKEICPPLYLTANEDDPTVPFINSTSLYESATSKNIPVMTKFGHTGGHSYGLGIGLEVDGWLDDAISFWSK
ncbi:MAG: alpha/beta hydrolase [Butyrivibrio sp.]|nr:alpha/beta hydrolase [Butyrivibrio sp.]